MALQPSPSQQVHIPATVPTQDPAQLGMTHWQLEPSTGL